MSFLADGHKNKENICRRIICEHGGGRREAVLRTVRQGKRRVGLVAAAAPPSAAAASSRTLSLHNLVLALGRRDLHEICQELLWESPAYGRRGAARACRSRQSGLSVWCRWRLLAMWGLGWEPVVLVAAAGEGRGAVTHRTGAPAEAARGL